jgi:hypothetical protein
MADESIPRDDFSEALRSFERHPEAVKARSLVDLTDFYGNHVTWVIRTFQLEGRRTVLLERQTAGGAERLVLPPEVVGAIERQGGAASAMVRSRGARKAAATRKARGIRPTFGRKG